MILSVMLLRLRGPLTFLDLALMHLKQSKVNIINAYLIRNFHIV